MKLRRNWAVEEMVTHFTQARSSMLAFAQRPPPRQESGETDRPKKRRKLEAPANAPERRSTRSQSRKAIQSASQASLEDVRSTQEEVADSEEEGSVYGDKEADSDGANGQEPHDGLVACPCCHRRMKEAAINAHLDRCVQGLPTSPSPPVMQPVSNGKASISTLSYAQRTKSPLSAGQKERLPTINYSLFTETSLRKKLKELGIPSHGNKELMRKRHTEWMNLWNANCDSLQPKAKSFLLKELDTWERTLGRQLEKGVTSSSSGVMVKDFDRDGWAKSQKGEFDDLIKRAREQRRAISKSNGQDEHSEPTSDVLMSNGPDTENIPPSAGPSDRPMAKHDASLGPNLSAPAGPTTTETNGVVERDFQTLLGAHPDVNSVSVTSRRIGLEQESVDLTSSPHRGPSESSPGKQRSKFFE